MNMKLENIPPCRIAYIRQTGAYGPKNNETMARLKDWAQANGLLNGETVIFGIAHDDLRTTPPEECRYDACIRLTDAGAATGEEIQRGSLNGGLYAVFTVEHTAQAVSRAWAELFPALAQSGSDLDPSRPIIERYASALVDQHLCEICVPILSTAI